MYSMLKLRIQGTCVQNWMSVVDRSKPWINGTESPSGTAAATRAIQRWRLRAPEGVNARTTIPNTGKKVIQVRRELPPPSAS
jgi:hypothetical protein